MLQRRLTTLLLIASLGACSGPQSHTANAYTFEATVVYSEGGDESNVPLPCNSAVVQDGMDVVLADPSDLGDDPVGVAELTDGKRVPWRQTFPDQFESYPDEYPLCTWSFDIPDVPAGRNVYSLTIDRRFRALLNESQVRDGVRLVITVIGSDKLEVLPARA